MIAGMALKSIIANPWKTVVSTGGANDTGYYRGCAEAARLLDPSGVLHALMRAQGCNQRWSAHYLIVIVGNFQELPDALADASLLHFISATISD